MTAAETPSDRFVVLDCPPAPGAQLQKRILSGEWVLLRGAMTDLGLFEPMKRASLAGIADCLGEYAGLRVEELGFERTHEVVNPADVPLVTEAVYKRHSRLQARVLRRAVPILFGSRIPFYFERDPNVRFQIPYDLASEYRALYASFRKKRGDGKITAHGPHRDSWLTCPINAINVWVAVGPVDLENGLVVYPEAYRRSVAHDGAYIRRDAALGTPIKAAMQPGDALIFHGEQLHATILNYSRHTRHVVSFRLTFGAPDFANGRFHHYAFAPLCKGPLKYTPFSRLAEVPARLPRKWFARSRSSVRDKAKTGQPERDAVETAAIGLRPGTPETASKVRHDSLSPGDVVAIDETTCVARLADGSFAAFDRYCAHEGADLSLGHVDGECMHCPWHSLPFNLTTGASPCKSIKKLNIYGIAVENEHLVLIRSETPAHS